MILATGVNRPVGSYLSRPQRREIRDLNQREIFLKRGIDLISGGCQRGMFCVADGVMSECFGSLDVCKGRECVAALSFSPP